MQPLTRDDLKGLPFKFPETIIRFATAPFALVCLHSFYVLHVYAGLRNHTVFFFRYKVGCVPYGFYPSLMQ